MSTGLTFDASMCTNKAIATAGLYPVDFNLQEGKSWLC